jgi:hypothetical protein
MLCRQQQQQQQQQPAGSVTEPGWRWRSGGWAVTVMAGLGGTPRRFACLDMCRPRVRESGCRWPVGRPCGRYADRFLRSQP